MNNELYLNRSTKRCVVFSLIKENFRYSYFSASSSEVNTVETIRRAYEGDVLIFGAYGPNYKNSYRYNVANMEYCIFLGGSEEYAQSDFLENIDNKIITQSPFKVRIAN